MKKYSLPLIGFLLILTSCSPTQNDAIKFNDELVTAQKMCVKAEEDFYKVCDKLNAKDIEKALVDFKKDAIASVEKVEKTEKPEEFDGYRQSALNLLSAYRNMIDQEFTEYAELYSLPDEEYMNEDEARQKELSDKINTLLDLLNKNFVDEQKRFSEKWDFILDKPID